MAIQIQPAPWCSAKVVIPIECSQKFISEIILPPNSIITPCINCRPANILKGLRALEFTNGVVTTVTDSEMLDGMSVVGLNGFDCEMASGASVAGIKKLMNEEIIKKDDTVVGILTGRQKDAMIPVDYHHDSENTFANPPKN